jgi:hypothetical protein
MKTTFINPLYVRKVYKGSESIIIWQHGCESYYLIRRNLTHAGLGFTVLYRPSDTMINTLYKGAYDSIAKFVDNNNNL